VLDITFGGLVMTESILYDRVGHVGRITLNIPEKHNALGREELKALQDRLAQVESDNEVRALILTGAGEKTFCAGASLAQLGAGELDDDSFQKTTSQLAGTAIPTLCALNGNVFGGGAELALSCDFRVGIEGTRMRVPAAALGLCYPLSGINLFVERLGLNVAKRVLVGSEEFEAEAMLDIGFLDHLVLRSQLQEYVMTYAQRIAGLAPLSVRAMKAILQQAAGGGVDDKEAKRLSDLCFRSDDLQEGLAAQREKRQPRFSGK
jgi:enoyl-CoA hydratase/carnithine racemase